MESEKNEKISKFRYIYSPRTTYNNKLLKENNLYNELFKSIDPYSIKILKKHFKERLGNINKETFICILKRHFITWNATLPNREEILIKLLSRLFDEIDINSNGLLDWNEFVNYTINSNSSINNNRDINRSLYSLQKYILCENKINHQEVNKIVGTKFNYMSSMNENISYCFYIEKYKLLGVAHDGQSKINFFDMETHCKTISEIDLITIENNINRLMFNKLSKNSEQLLMKEIKKEINNSKRVETPDSLKSEIKNINQEKIFDSNKNVNNKYKKERKYSAVCALFIEESDILFISSTNNIVSAWKYNQLKKEFKNINLDTEKSSIYELDNLNIPLYALKLPQYTMCFDNGSKYLYTGQEDGKIYKWRLNSNKPVHIFEISKITDNKIHKSIRKKLNNIQKDKGISFDKKNFMIMENKNKVYGKAQNTIKEFKHNSIFRNDYYNRETVSCILIINKLRLLCSGYYSGNIILWDTTTHNPKIIYNDQQTGIYHLEYNSNKNQIYSCGFDHSIYVYNPYHEENAIYKCKSHLSSINSISFNSKTNELISVDILGNIVIWDTDKFIPYQTININESFFLEQQNHNKKQIEILKKSKKDSNLFVITLKNLNKFIIYGEKLIIYEKGKILNPLLCDDNAIIGCRYSKKTNDIITFSNKRVKFWNIFTGKMHKIFDNLMEDIGITAFEIDNKEKKFYLGDNSGRVKCFNILNGNPIKEFKSHKMEILHILHSSKYRIIITASSDLYIKFHNDKDEEEKSSIIREISVRPLTSLSLKDKILIKNILLDEISKTFIIGLSNGNITYFDMNYYKFINNNEQIDNLSKIALSNIQDLEDTNCLFIAYENGEKYIMAKNSNRYYLNLLDHKFGIFEKEENELKEEYNNNKKNIVLVSQYDKTTNKLLTGNQIGFIICYNLSSLLDIFNNNYEINDRTIKDIFNKLYFPIIFKVECHKESITYINIPYELEPRIFFTCSTDRTIKLLDLNNGNYIDSLKQLSFKNNPKPIAIKFFKDNPFMKNNEKIYNDLYNDDFTEDINLFKNTEKENVINDNINIMYKELLEKKIKEPNINYDMSYKGEIIDYCNKLIEYNAKKKLDNYDRIQTYEKKLSNKNQSREWNYKINIEKIIHKNDLELSLLKNKINKLEEEINDSENNFQHMSIFNKYYKPLYIKNIKEEEYDSIQYEISHKIKNINLGLAKNEMRKKEILDILKFQRKVKGSNSTNKIKSPTISTPFKKINKEIYFNSEESHKSKKKLSKELFKNIINKKIKNDNRNNFNNLSSQGLFAKKFYEYKNNFDKRYNELNESIKKVFHKKILEKKKLLPKLLQNKTQIQNIENIV